MYQCGVSQVMAASPTSPTVRAMPARSTPSPTSTAGAGTCMKGAPEVKYSPSCATFSLSRRRRTTDTYSFMARSGFGYRSPRSCCWKPTGPGPKPATYGAPERALIERASTAAW